MKQQSSMKEMIAIASPYPDGQRLDTIIIGYNEEILGEKLSKEDFEVKDRTIVSVYSNSIPEPTKKPQNGKYVVLELDIKEENAKIIPEPVRYGENNSEKDKFEKDKLEAEEPTSNLIPQGVPHLPQLKRRIIEETFCQKRDIETVIGNIIPRELWEHKTTKVIQPVIDSFIQGSFQGISYNLYCPMEEPDRKYPLVVFVHDAGPNGDDPFLALAQGNGATSFASLGDQNKHPAFVLAPQIPKNVYLTRDDFTCAEEIETIKSLIDEIAEKYPVDYDRIYYTGQSQGCMAGCELNVRYPDYFAASLLAAGQWNPETVGQACHSCNFWILVSDGDKKAYPGMQAVTDALEQNGARAGRYHWNAKWSEEKMRQAVIEAAQDGCNIRFSVFDDHSVIPEGGEDNPGTNHMGTWPVVYSIQALRDWLFTQRKER